MNVRSPRRFRRLLLPLVACIFLVVLGSVGLAEEPRRPEVQELARGNNQFAWDLYRQLRGGEGNLFFSPYSISTAVAMTATGARGDTAAEMTKVLHLPADAGKYAAQYRQMQAYLLDQARSYELNIANALWGQKAHPFKQDFIAGLQQHFRADGRTLDFADDPEGSRTTINRWVEEKTKDRIKDLIPSGVITRQTRLVLTNAIYFKGKWSKPFRKESTRPDDFFLPGGETVRADLMRRTGDMAYAESDSLQAVSLPYEGGRLAMVVLLPRKKGGLGELEAGLTAESVDALVKGLRTRQVNLHLPRTKTTASFGLKPALTALGMPTAFTADADFSGIDGTRELFLGEVIHKAFCEVNEEGTEAAAATGAVMKATAAPVQDPPVEFKADHPYLYLIRDTQTGCLLFLGRMTDPRP